MARPFKCDHEVHRAELVVQQHHKPPEKIVGVLDDNCHNPLEQQDEQSDQKHEPHEQDIFAKVVENVTTDIVVSVVGGGCAVYFLFVHFQVVVKIEWNQADPDCLEDLLRVEERAAVEVHQELEEVRHLLQQGSCRRTERSGYQHGSGLCGSDGVGESGGCCTDGGSRRSDGDRE